MMRNEESYEEIIKIIIVGDSGVGKTCFLHRFCHSTFKPNGPCTVGLDYGQRILLLGDRKVMVQLWDTAGQQKFKTITPSFYRSATAIILMFSVDSRDSFNSVAVWMMQIKTFATENIPILLVGNKADLVKKQVSQKQAHSLADANKLDLMMTSCQKNINIDQSVEILCRLVKKTTSNHLKLSKRNNQEKKCWC